MAKKSTRLSNKKSEGSDQIASEFETKFQRLQADFDNFRKHTLQERLRLQGQAKAEALLDVIPVLDNFERSVRHMPEELKSSEWATGILHIKKQFEDILNSQGLEKIRTDIEFDPTLHDAISYEQNSKFKKDQIIEEVESGYKLGDEVLRPAKVRVAK
jgi:molecular chaperone GrpE